MRIEPRKDWDVFAIAVLTLLLIASIYLTPESPLRIAIGLPFLLFFPGYLSIAALFPSRDDLDSIERVALSFGLSIAITPLIGFGLNYTPWGIRLSPILLSVSFFIFIAAALTLYRRQTAEDPFLPFDPVERLSGVWTSFQEEKGLDKALSVILALSILSSVLALGYVIAFPRDGEDFTEFYVLGPDGMASGYPQLAVGEEGSVILGLVNHEHRTMDYTIVVWLVKLEYADEQAQVHELYYYDTINVNGLEHVPVDIESTWAPQWEHVYEFNIFTVGVPLDGNYKVWFSLFKSAMTFDYDIIDDYSGDEEAVGYIREAVRNERQSLNLNMRLSPSHLYLRDQTGTGFDIPTELDQGDGIDITLGVTNHGSAASTYQALVMLADLEIAVNNSTGVKTVDSFDGVYFLAEVTTGWENLLSPDVNKGDPWAPSVPQSVNLVFSDMTGELSVWVFLFQDEVMLTLAASQDYSADDRVTGLFDKALSGERQYLAFAMTVNP